MGKCAGGWLRVCVCVCVGLIIAGTHRVQAPFINRAVSGSTLCLFQGVVCQPGYLGTVSRCTNWIAAWEKAFAEPTILLQHALDTLGNSGSAYR